MSTVPSEAIPTTYEPLTDIFDYPGADVILCSQDSRHLRVPKIFIIHYSPVLNELVRKTLESPGDANAEASLPVIRLQESGRILRYLLTFILPVFPVIPPTHEETMELLSVAQRYQMEKVLVHIRGIVARQNPLPTQLEPALHVYALAQKYGLRPEALQTARSILKNWMTIEDFDNKLDIMPGASLYELWKYHERVRTFLASDLTEFRDSGAHRTITGLRCTGPGLTSSRIPRWLDQYIESIAKNPKLFDTAELNIAMARHIKDGDSHRVGWMSSRQTKPNSCECASISSQTIRNFWEALTSAVHGSFEKAESALSLVEEWEEPQTQINPISSPPETLDAADMNLIIRSSDLVNFRVRKSVLAAASPFFKDLLSLPQPPDSETVDGLPMVQMPEDSELLNSLVSNFYPIQTVLPNSYEKVLYLLAACQKYEMVSVQSSIRAEVSRGAFPAPSGADAFSAYAIASAKGLTPEMEYAARLTLNYPMTFEILGEALREFEGRALRDLAKFRKRCRDKLVSCFESFLEACQSSSNIWISCSGSDDQSHPSPARKRRSSASPWLIELFRKNLNELRDAFSKPLFDPRNIRGEYLSTLQDHVQSSGCVSCAQVHTLKGETFCKELEGRLTQALKEKLVIREQAK